MAYDEFLAERVRRILTSLHVGFEEKKMMGGVCYMVDDKMCLGVVKTELMARIDPEKSEEALSVKGSRPMDFTGKSMKGFVFVDPAGTDMEQDLERWVLMALDFNPRAQSSKKKKK
jgi:hypothetical protein